MARHGRVCSKLTSDFEVKKERANLDLGQDIGRLDRLGKIDFAEHNCLQTKLQCAVKKVEESIFSCRSQEVAVKAQVSQLRELASEGELCKSKSGYCTGFISGAE